MASFILMPFMLVFHQSKSINAIKRTLFYYCYTYIFIFFHVIMCSLSLRCILPRLRVEVKTKSNTILQLNTKGLTVSRISAIEQLVDKNKALVTINQKNLCIKADKLVIPSFSLTASVLSRKQGLATLVHMRLE